MAGWIELSGGNESLEQDNISGGGAIKLLNHQDRVMLLQILVVMRTLDHERYNKVMDRVDREKHASFVEETSLLTKNDSLFGPSNKYKQHFQENVKLVLKENFSEDQMEFEVFSGFYPYDIYFPFENLVVEINGSTHYYDLTQEKMPKYQLKQLLFDAAGIDYLDIDYHDFLDKDKEIKTSDLIKAVQDRLEACKGKQKIEAKGIFTRMLLG